MQQMAKNESRVNKKKSMLSKDKQIKSSDNTVEGLALSRLDKRGVDTTKMIETLHTEAARGRKRSRSDASDDMDVEDEFSSKRGKGTDGGFVSRRKEKRDLSANGKRNRPIDIAKQSRATAVAESVAPRQAKQVKKEKRVLERHLFKFSKRGEADHEHYPKLVKHLNSGKSGLGTSTIGR